MKHLQRKASKVARRGAEKRKRKKKEEAAPTARWDRFVRGSLPEVDKSWHPDWIHPQLGAQDRPLTSLATAQRTIFPLEAGMLDD